MATGGGFKAIAYTLKSAAKIGPYRLARTMFSKNTCKTCALGMGGQLGGMRNEKGEFPEFCKKSIQAQLTDIQKPIPVNFFSQNSIEQLKELSPQKLEQLGRLSHPVYKKAGDTHYTPISWDRSYSLLQEAYQKTNPDRSFFYASGRSSNEAAFVLQLFARLWGTNNVNNCSYYCHQASGVGMGATLGTGTATLELKDLDKADTIFVFGANPASNHPRFLKELVHCRRRGGKIIVVNPTKEGGLVKFAIPSDMRSLLSGGSKIADEYIQIHIGGDIAFMTGLSKWILENNYEDQKYLDNHTQGFSDWKASILSQSWESIVQQSGVTQETIKHIAQIYSKSSHSVFSWAMGITHHTHGVQNVESLVHLALLRGMIGKEGAGMLPLRGHSNVQGIGSMGVTPTLKDAIFQNIESHFNLKLPTKLGLDTMACMQAAYQEKIDLAFFLGGNLYASNPDSKKAAISLNKIPFQVHLNTTLNQGHLFTTEGEVLLLPVCTRDEEQQSTTQESMFNFVRLSDGGPSRVLQARSEMEIISTLASRVVEQSVFDFKPFLQTDEVRMAIAQIIPGFKDIESLAQSKKEFHIQGRILKNNSFPSPDKRAHFAPYYFPEKQHANHTFQMMSLRSEGQYNSIVYEEKDTYRDQKSRWVVLMNPEDIQKGGYKKGQQVTLKSDVGEMKNLVIQPYDIRSGNLATYYPESNVLVSQNVDPRSRTPGYKNVKVWIEV